MAAERARRMDATAVRDAMSKFWRWKREEGAGKRSGTRRVSWLFWRRVYLAPASTANRPKAPPAQRPLLLLAPFPKVVLSK